VHEQAIFVGIENIEGRTHVRVDPMDREGCAAIRGRRVVIYDGVEKSIRDLIDASKRYKMELATRLNRGNILPTTASKVQMNYR
jgi:hypothetical protein